MNSLEKNNMTNKQVAELDRSSSQTILVTLSSILVQYFGHKSSSFTILLWLISAYRTSKDEFFYFLDLQVFHTSHEDELKYSLSNSKNQMKIIRGWFLDEMVAWCYRKDD